MPNKTEGLSRLLACLLFRLSFCSPSAILEGGPFNLLSSSFALASVSVSHAALKSDSDWFRVAVHAYGSEGLSAYIPSLAAAALETPGHPHGIYGTRGGDGTNESVSGSAGYDSDLRLPPTSAPPTVVQHDPHFSSAAESAGWFCEQKTKRGVEGGGCDAASQQLLEGAAWRCTRARGLAPVLASRVSSLDCPSVQSRSQ